MRRPAKRGKLGAGEVAEGVERGDAEPLFERALAAHGIEMGARDRRQRGARLADDAADIRIAREIVTDQHLAGLDACKLAGKIAEADRRRDQLAGRDVDGGQRDRRLGAVLLGRAEQRGEEIVRAGIEQRLLGERARRDEPHHVAADHRFRPALLGLGRVLGLLAHGDAEALGDQPLEIVVGGMDRHAAHGNVLAEMLAALGERDAERARGDGRIVEEQLVEVAHAVEQEAVGVGRLDLQVLRHHGRGVR